MKAVTNILLALVFLSINAFSQDIDDIKFAKKINQLRSGLGLNELQWDATLDSAAQAWVNEMLEAFDNYSNEEIDFEYSNDMTFIHINFDQRVKNLRTNSGVSFKGKFISEIAVLSVDDFYKNKVEESFRAWKNSRFHYLAMVRESAESFGFTYIEDKKRNRGLYICLISGKSK